MKWNQPDPKKAVLAAAHEVKLNDWGDVARSLASREDWQYRCHDLNDAIGQLKDASGRFADILSKINIYPAKVTGNPGDPPEETDEEVALKPLKRLHDSSDGIQQIINEMVRHGMVAGECNLVGLGEREDKPERWWIASISEVEGTTPVQVRDPEDPLNQSLIRLTQEDDFVARIWRRHLRYGAKADSPFRGIMADAEEYLIYGRAIRAITKSRVGNNGLFLYPDDVDFPVPENDDGREDPFMRMLRLSMTTPLADEGAASAVVPLVLGVPRESIEFFKHVPIPRELDDKLIQLRKDALEHISQGLPLPPEFIFGLSDANHWNGGQISEDAFNQYFEPWANWAVNSLTMAYYRPSLEAAGVANPEQYVLWYDPARMVTNTKAVDSANDAHDRIVISDERYREILGYSDDDAPDDAERERRLEELRILRSRQNSTSDQTATPVQAAATQPDDLGEILEQMDAALMSRMEGAAIMAEKRVMERAGSRIKTLAKKDKDAQAAVASVAPKAVAATLGRAKVASLTTADDLLTDAWDDLASYWETEVADLQADVLDRIQVNDPVEREQLTAAMERNRRDAWKWLEAQLSERAMNALYDNVGPVLPFVREAMGRAGQV